MTANTDTSRRPVDLRASGGLLDAEDVAALLKTSTAHVRELSRRGRRDRLPSLKIGGPRRYILGDVEAWIADRRERL